MVYSVIFARTFYTLIQQILHVLLDMQNLKENGQYNLEAKKNLKNQSFCIQKKEVLLL